MQLNVLINIAINIKCHFISIISRIVLIAREQDVRKAHFYIMLYIRAILLLMI